MSQEKAINISLFLLRVVAMVMFIQVGGLKLFGWFGGLPPQVPLAGLILAAGILEFFGGIAVLLGIFTRPIAFILSGEMAFAFFMGHFKMATPWPVQNHGELAVFFCFFFLFLSAYGAGKLSLDGWMKSRKAALQKASSTL